jgi:predicted acyl esterase
LLLGPGTHCAPPPGIDFAGEVKRFFDAELRGVAPAEPPPRVTWWLDGVPTSEAWQRSARWPGAEAPRQAWYLAAAPTGGEARLQPRVPRASTAEFRVDYAVGDGGNFPFWVESQHGRGLSFTSEPLREDQELVGYAVAHLRVSSDRPEPLLFGYLEQLAPDGTVTVLSFGRLGAAYRKTGAPPYATLGLPWHTGLAADYAPLTRGESVELSFALTPTSRVIAAGSRLRFVVTGADPRQRNLQELRVDPSPLIALDLGRHDGARVELPLRPHGASPVAALEGHR